MVGEVVEGGVALAYFFGGEGVANYEVAAQVEVVFLFF